VPVVGAAALTERRLVLRSWRVVEAEPSGLFVWYDPSREAVQLYEVEPPMESGVGDPCEGDDQRSLWSSREELDSGLPPGEEGLPF